MWCVSQEMSQRKAQVEYEHNMLVRHHESTQDLEYKHLAALQKCKDEQLKRQHETEKENQRDYNSRAEQELKKKHALEVKQQPRSLKVGWACLALCLSVSFSFSLSFSLFLALSHFLVTVDWT